MKKKSLPWGPIWIALVLIVCALYFGANVLLKTYSFVDPKIPVPVPVIQDGGYGSTTGIFEKTGAAADGDTLLYFVTEDGKPQYMYVKDEVVITDANGVVISLSDLVPGMRIKASGPTLMTLMSAERIEILK